MGGGLEDPSGHVVEQPASGRCGSTAGAALARPGGWLQECGRVQDRNPGA
ncbi:MAG TPA: hypothetical protein VD833_23950 [Vicinamibacterales bacterium]|nr:hypothetical protein [Vicinamibacterales bacterium]